MILQNLKCAISIENCKTVSSDRNKDSSEEKMAQINKAYEVLSDKKLKAEYDKFCKLL